MLSDRRVVRYFLKASAECLQLIIDTFPIFHNPAIWYCFDFKMAGSLLHKNLAPSRSPKIQMTAIRGQVIHKQVLKRMC